MWPEPKPPEGQALWQPGDAEEDSRFLEDNRHLRLGYEEEEEDEASSSFVLLQVGSFPERLYFTGRVKDRDSSVTDMMVGTVRRPP